MKTIKHIADACFGVMLILIVIHLYSQLFYNNKIDVTDLTKAQQLQLSEFYSDFANVVADDTDNTLSTTTRFRDLHNKAGIKCFGDTMKGHPKTYQSINKILNNALNISATIDPSTNEFNDVNISAEQKSRIVAALKQISDDLAK